MMVIWKHFLFLIFITSIISCQEDPFNCDTNTQVVNEGKESCAVAVVTKYSPLDTRESIFLNYSSSNVADMDITLYSPVGELIKTGDVYDWHNGIIFYPIVNDEIISGQASISNVNRKDGLISFVFELKYKKVNNNFYVVSGTVTDLKFL